VIKGYVHALARRGEAMEPAARARMLAEMQGQAGRLERLLEDLLLLSGMKAQGSIELERADENLVALADGVLDRFRAEHPGRAFELRAPAPAWSPTSTGLGWSRSCATWSTTRSRSPRPTRPSASPSARRTSSPSSRSSTTA